MTTTLSSDLTDEIVFGYWERKAAEMGEDRTATIRDRHFHDLEIDTIKRYLRPTDTVLDIGCGNGYATTRFAEQVSRIVGVDYSPGMIEAAEQRLNSQPGPKRSNVEFQTGDARSLPFSDQMFSRVIMQRCLINIPAREEQVQAALEAGRVLQSGGLMLLAEVTLQGHQQVNHYRRMFGLEDLKTHWHNTYLDEAPFLDSISSALRVHQIIRFGMYGFLSKVLHTLVVHPDEPQFEARINEVAAMIARTIPDFDGCSHQVLFVLEKK